VVLDAHLRQPSQASQFRARRRQAVDGEITAI
jgi:hypothetical protein